MLINPTVSVNSTLEEAVYADIIIHVVDASDSEYDNKMKVVYKTLHSLKVENKPIITLFNKCDVQLDDEIFVDERADKVIKISAKTGMGLETFKDTLRDFLRNGKELKEKVLTYDEAGRVFELKQKYEIVEEDYRDDGIYLKGYFD